MEALERTLGQTFPWNPEGIPQRQLQGNEISLCASLPPFHLTLKPPEGLSFSEERIKKNM